MVPIQSSLTVTLPMSKGSHHDHNPFPGDLPNIIRFNEKVRLKSGYLYSYVCHFGVGGGSGISAAAKEDQYSCQ